MQIAFPGFDSIRFMEFKNLVTLAVLVMATGYAQAQQQIPLHLNPAVEKLAHGQPIIGTQTDDMSLQNCHALARQDVDYSYVDMEHGPLNLDGLAFCIAAMADKARFSRRKMRNPMSRCLRDFLPTGVTSKAMTGSSSKLLTWV
jgi:hypothetical protein